MIGFALGASVVMALSAACIAWWLAGRDAVVTSWATVGFVAMAVPGIAGGSWLAREHGRPESRFVIALATGLVARLVFAAAAAFGAAKAGGGAGFGLICGLAVGFVPLIAFEAVWFACADRVPGLDTETRA